MQVQFRLQSADIFASLRCTQTILQRRRFSSGCRSPRLRLEASLGQGGQGLFNQHLSLLSFLTIGIAARADELLITGSMRRDKWAKDATWALSDFSDIWDASAIEAYLAGHGIVFLTGEQPGDSSVRVLTQADLPAHRDPADSAAFVRKHVANHTGEAEGSLAPHRGAAVRTVQVPMRGLLLSTLTQHSHLHAEVARTVRFSGHLQDLADKAIARLHELTGAAAFNGVHLRIEGDSPNQDFMNGRQAMLRAYSDAFSEAGFDAALPLYLSSGVFESEPGFAGTWLHNQSSLNTHKELLLPEADLGPLHSEQKAAVDFLVLVKARKFVGWAGSSFSFWAYEHRRMAGLPADSTLLIRREEAGSSIHDLFVLSNTVI